MKQWILIGSFLLLGGCTAIPEPIQVANDDALVSYTQALEQSATAVGKEARWGGVIAEVSNSDAGTVIEVVNFDLQSWGRPLIGDQSSGRFRALIDGFVDPMVYKQGSAVTFTGRVQEPQFGTIGEYNYLFPVLQVSGKYLWPKQAERTHVEVNYDALWYRHYYYTRPYYPGPIILPGRVMQEQPKKDQ